MNLKTAQSLQIRILIHGSVSKPLKLFHHWHVVVAERIAGNTPLQIIGAGQGQGATQTMTAMGTFIVNYSTQLLGTYRTDKDSRLEMLCGHQATQLPVSSHYIYCMYTFISYHCKLKSSILDLDGNTYAYKKNIERAKNIEKRAQLGITTELLSRGTVGKRYL